MGWRRRLSLHAGPLIGLFLGGLALWPVLSRRGYVLVGDMVFLPHPPLSRSLLGLSGAPPRAVPSDLLAAGLGQLLPGDVVQKLALLAVFVLAAAGGARLLAGCPLGARATGATLLAWNPYVAERLALGQWAVLLGYAALPWVLIAAARLRGDGRGAWPVLLLSLALAALTPSGGLVAVGAALLVLTCGRAPAWRPAGLLLAAGLVLNGPWLAPALLRPTGLPALPTGVDAFAARADTPLGVLGSLGSLGGIWAPAAVPPGRSAGGLVPVALLLLAGVVAGCLLLLRGRAPLWPTPAAIGLVAAAGVALTVAAAGALPGSRELLRSLVRVVPEAGLLRDGPRHLGPLAVLEAAALGLAAQALSERLPGLRRSFAGLAAAVPVLLLPGLALGISGRIHPVQYPPEWARARQIVDADPAAGALLALPWSTYRAPRWNGGRTVLDPAGKAFARRVVADDRLRLGTLVVAGEDPLAARLEPVATGSGSLLAAGPLGIRWVLVERGAAPDPDSPAAGRLVGARLRLDTAVLGLWQLPGSAVRSERTPPAAPVVAADLAAAVLVLLAGGAWLRRRARDR